MSQVLYTSDLHFRDAKVSALRGFASVDAHDEAMIATWNQQVRRDDIVYVLGDLTSGRSREVEQWAIEAMLSLPGRKRLVSGNHDTSHPMHSASRDPERMRDWYRAFESVDPIGMRKTSKRHIMLSHFPYDGPDGDHTPANRHTEWRPVDVGLWLLHGHTHREQQRVHERQIHVGFEAWGRLVTEAEVLRMIAEAEAGQQQA